VVTLQSGNQIHYGKCNNIGLPGAVAYTSDILVTKTKTKMIPILKLIIKLKRNS